MKKATDFSRLEIKGIAEEYANNSVSRSHFVEKYMITKCTFYTILDKAIIEQIVSYETIIKMRERAISNTNIKIGRHINPKNIISHYEELISKRKNFLFTKHKRLNILKDFANRDLSISKIEFCNLNAISVKLFDKVFIQSIIYREIPEKLYQKIKSNSLKSSINHSTLILFILLEDFRDKVKSGENLDVNDVYNNIFNTIKEYISNPDMTLKQLSFTVKDGDLVIK